MTDTQTYTFNDFEKIQKFGNINEFDSDIIQIINDLASKVGAPNYNKTPVFKKRNRNINMNRSNLTNKDWENIRNFKVTQLEKSEDAFKILMDDIRINLNKLTNNNFQEIYNNINKIMKKVIKEDKEKDKHLKEISKSIFDIGSMNHFWSNLYAKLYKFLIIDYDFMKDICIENFNNYLDIFDDVEVDPEDYDALCKYNKANENRKGISSFFVNMMIYEVIDTELIYNLLFKIFEKVNLITKDLKYEYFENVSVIFMDGKDKLYENTESFNKFKEKIILYSKSPDINRKTKFKCLDIVEMIEGLEED
tara:strand:- start:1973 stop:2893 length:921 start_codon:yes stop_codon:yes gene_type:complete